jgi:hypothetical protein
VLDSPRRGYRDFSAVAVGAPEPRGGARSRSLISAGWPCADGESMAVSIPCRARSCGRRTPPGTASKAALGQRVCQRRRLLRWTVTIPATTRRAGSTSPHSNQPFTLSNPPVHVLAPPEPPLQAVHHMHQGRRGSSMHRRRRLESSVPYDRLRPLLRGAPSRQPQALQPAVPRPDGVRTGSPLPAQRYGWPGSVAPRSGKSTRFGQAPGSASRDAEQQNVATFADKGHQGRTRDRPHAVQAPWRPVPRAEGGQPRPRPHLVAGERPC